MCRIESKQASENLCIELKTKKLYYLESQASLFLLR